MNDMRTKLMAGALVAALALLPAMEASARGGFRGGGFRAASSLRSFGSARSIGNLSSGWGSAFRPTLRASPKAQAPRATALTGGIPGRRSSASAQRSLYDSARKNGTLFSSKAEASQAFKSRYAKDYGSSFASEPAARPSYIPSSAMVGGRNVNIVYNQGLGGYGYLHPTLGTWMLFDALGDAMMMDSVMSSRGYYWGGTPAYVTHGPGYLGLAFAALAILLVAALAARVAAGRGPRRRGWY
jgi:hypothetical protein